MFYSTNHVIYTTVAVGLAVGLLVWVAHSLWNRLAQVDGVFDRIRAALGDDAPTRERTALTQRLPMSRLVAYAVGVGFVGLLVLAINAASFGNTAFGFGLLFGSLGPALVYGGSFAIQSLLALSLIGLPRNKSLAVVAVFCMVFSIGGAFINMVSMLAGPQIRNEAIAAREDFERDGQLRFAQNALDAEAEFAAAKSAYAEHIAGTLASIDALEAAQGMLQAETAAELGGAGRSSGMGIRYGTFHDASNMVQALLTAPRSWRSSVLEQLDALGNSDASLETRWAGLRALAAQTPPPVADLSGVNWPDRSVSDRATLDAFLAAVRSAPAVAHGTFSLPPATARGGIQAAEFSSPWLTAPEDANIHIRDILKFTSNRWKTAPVILAALVAVTVDLLGAFSALLLGHMANPSAQRGPLPKQSRNGRPAANHTPAPPRLPGRTRKALLDQACQLPVPSLDAALAALRGESCRMDARAEGLINQFALAGLGTYDGYAFDPDPDLTPELRSILLDARNQSEYPDGLYTAVVEMSRRVILFVLPAPRSASRPAKPVSSTQPLAGGAEPAWDAAE